MATSGATEAIDLAIVGLERWASERQRRHIVVSRIEHTSCLAAVRALEERGFSISWISPAPDGCVQARDVIDAIRPDTGLVCLMHANNETGALQPVVEVADALVDDEVSFFVDASQSAGSAPEELRHPRIDLMAISGHKLHAPVGVGALLIRERARGRLHPRLMGAHSFSALRPGTPSVALTVALATAVRLAWEERDVRRAAALKLRERILDELSRVNATIWTPLERSLPHVISAAIPGLESGVAIASVAELVSISRGSACHSGGESSHVLDAMGIDATASACTLRLSWSFLTPRPPMKDVVTRWSSLRAPLPPSEPRVSTAPG